MHDTSRAAQALLSLFTSSDRAESITGDLTEERFVRGSAWFWFHVFGTTFALFRSAFASAPLAILALVAGEALLIAFWLFFPWDDAPNLRSVLVYTSALFAAAPLLGGAIVRRRMAT